MDRHGADINAGNTATFDGTSHGVLELACLGWHPASLEVVRLLVHCPLGFSCQRPLFDGDRGAIRPGLDINRSWKVETTDQFDRTLRILEWACSKYTLQRVRYMLPKAREDDGGLRQVPAVDIVKELLKHPNIDVNVVSGDRATSALARACICASVDIVTVLLQHHNIDINVSPPWYPCGCCLRSAITPSSGLSLGHLEVVSLLLRQPALEEWQITSALEGALLAGESSCVVPGSP